MAEVLSRSGPARESSPTKGNGSVTVPRRPRARSISRCAYRHFRRRPSTATRRIIGQYKGLDYERARTVASSFEFISFDSNRSAIDVRTDDSPRGHELKGA